MSASPSDGGQDPANVDDVWGDDSDEDAACASSQNDLSRDWESRRNQFWNAGYREGLEAGQLEYVKKGFLSGFADGVEHGFKLGAARGMLQAMLQSQPNHAEPPLSGSVSTAALDLQSLCQELEELRMVSRQPKENMQARPAVGEHASCGAASADSGQNIEDTSGFMTARKQGECLLAKVNNTLKSMDTSLIASQADLETGKAL
mmetsp:Transcript_28234/g.79689  ORF Transcript_28234/g.79689 Transcript_28234/m.79689 type:complete len:204 (-) Transcript_28234:57-668(-)